MHEFTVVDLAGLIAASLALFGIFGPVARAIAKRIEGRAPTAITEDPAFDQLRGEMDELHERIDFLERAIAARQPPPELPKERTPV
jgi:hypothetical protein